MLIVFLFVFLLGCIIAATFSINALVNTLRYGLPYVTTPGWAIEWIEKNIFLSKNDTVYELGCGDARVISALAKERLSTQFIGIEVQWWPFLLGKWRTRNQKNVRIVYGDIFQHDLSPATVVYGFFITNFMSKLTKKLEKDLQPDAKVISFGFRLPDWTPVQEVNNPNKPNGSKVLVYRR